MTTAEAAQLVRAELQERTASPVADLDVEFSSLDLDSLDQVELVVALEDRLGVAPDGSELERLRSPQDVVDLLVRLLP